MPTSCPLPLIVSNMPATAPEAQMSDTTSTVIKILVRMEELLSFKFR